jgi:hypothetical protein
MDNPTKTNQEAQGPTIQCQMMKRKKKLKKTLKKIELKPDSSLKLVN